MNARILTLAAMSLVIGAVAACAPEATTGTIPPTVAPATASTDTSASPTATASVSPTAPAGKIVALTVTGTGATLTATVTFRSPPPTGPGYWIVDRSSTSQWYAKTKIKGEIGTNIYIITLDPGTDHNSDRTFYVVSGSGSGATWLAQNHARDSDIFARNELPGTVVLISDPVPSHYD